MDVYQPYRRPNYIIAKNFHISLPCLANPPLYVCGNKFGSSLLSSSIRGSWALEGKLWSSQFVSAAGPEKKPQGSIYQVNNIFWIDSFMATPGLFSDIVKQQANFKVS